MSAFDKSARCVNCKFFEKMQYPVKSWEERKAEVLEKYNGMSEEEAETLASNKSLFETIAYKWGKCKYKKLPELRDVELDGDNFGCIHFKK